jgi:hypothetical protein
VPIGAPGSTYEAVRRTDHISRSPPDVTPSPTPALRARFGLIVPLCARENGHAERASPHVAAATLPRAINRVRVAAPRRAAPPLARHQLGAPRPPVAPGPAAEAVATGASPPREVPSQAHPDPWASRAPPGRGPRRRSPSPPRRRSR